MNEVKIWIRYVVAIIISLIVAVIGANIALFVLSFIDGIFNVNILYHVSGGNGFDVIGIEMTWIGKVIYLIVAALIFIALLKTISNRRQPKSKK